MMLSPVLRAEAGMGLVPGGGEGEEEEESMKLPFCSRVSGGETK